VVVRKKGRFSAGNDSSIVSGGGGMGAGDFWQQELRRSSRSLIENPAGGRGFIGAGTSMRSTVE
jgi:hypothetical protein